MYLIWSLTKFRGNLKKSMNEIILYKISFNFLILYCVSVHYILFKLLIVISCGRMDPACVFNRSNNSYRDLLSTSQGMKKMTDSCYVSILYFKNNVIIITFCIFPDL